MARLARRTQLGNPTLPRCKSVGVESVAFAIDKYPSSHPTSLEPIDRTHYFTKEHKQGIFPVDSVLTRTIIIEPCVGRNRGQWDDVMRQLQNGFFMNWLGKQQGEGYEYHLLVIGIGLALLVTGAGKWLVDKVIAERVRA
jgi:hypothetical protein